jgi:hypothetical protein
MRPSASRPGRTGRGTPPVFVLCRPPEKSADRRPAVAVENELVEPSESGRILVLLADRLLENIDFDVAGLFRDAAGRKKSLRRAFRSE